MIRGLNISVGGQTEGVSHVNRGPNMGKTREIQVCREMSEENIRKTLTTNSPLFIPLNIYSGILETHLAESRGGKNLFTAMASRRPAGGVTRPVN